MFAVSIAAHGDKNNPSAPSLLMHCAYLDDAPTIELVVNRAREYAPRYFAIWNINYRSITISVNNHVLGQTTNEHIQNYHELYIRKVEE